MLLKVPLKCQEPNIYQVRPVLYVCFSIQPLVLKSSLPMIFKHCVSVKKETKWFVNPICSSLFYRVWRHLCCTQCINIVIIDIDFDAYEEEEK